MHANVPQPRLQNSMPRMQIVCHVAIFQPLWRWNWLTITVEANRSFNHTKEFVQIAHTDGSVNENVTKEEPGNSFHAR